MLSSVAHSTSKARKTQRRGIHTTFWIAFVLGHRSLQAHAAVQEQTSTVQNGNRETGSECEDVRMWSVMVKTPKMCTSICER